MMNEMELESRMLEKVRMNVSFDELREKKHILIVRSAKASFLIDFLQKLEERGGKKRISIVGDDTDKDFLDSHDIKCENLYVHNERIDFNFAKTVAEKIRDKSIDAVVYFNYSVIRRSYENVVNFCSVLFEEYKIPIYSYLVKDRQLNHFIDATDFHKGLMALMNNDNSYICIDEVASNQGDSLPAFLCKKTNSITVEAYKKKKKLKILICNERFLFRFGVDRVLLMLGSEWKKMGHEVIMMGNKLDPAAVEKCSDRFIHIPEAQDYFYGNNYTASYISSHWDEWFCEEEKPDVAFITGWPYYKSIDLLRKKCGCVIFQDHGAVPTEGMAGGMLNTQNELRRLRRENLKYANKVIAVSQFLEESQSKVDVDGWTETGYVLNGVDHIDKEIWKNKELGIVYNNGLLDEIKSLKKCGYKLLFLPGRWEEGNYKNSVESIEILKGLKALGHKVKIMVLANSEDLSSVSDSEKKDFLCLGFVDDMTMRCVMEQCDVAFQPTLWEGFNLPLGEVQYLNKPMYVYDIGAHPEVVADRYFLCKDLSEMVKKVSDCLSNNMPFSKNQLKKIYNDYKNKMTWENTANCIINDIYRKLEDNETLFIVDTTNACQDTANSGVMRVTRKVSRYLQQLTRTIFVMWDSSILKYVFPYKGEIQRLCSYGGPIEQKVEFLSEDGKARKTLDDVLPYLDEKKKIHLFTETVNNGIMQQAIPYFHKNGIYVASIFYDAIAVLRPELCNIDVSNNHKKYMKELSLCDLVIPIAKHNQFDLENFWKENGIKKTKVKTIQLAAEMDQIERNYEIVSKNINNSARLLFVSTLEPRKNHIRFLRAYDNLMKNHSELNDRVELTIVGNRYAGNDEIPSFVEQFCKKNKNVKWLGVVDDKTLHKLYSECDLTVYPSEIEGFGMPIIESLWFGKPCLCNKSGSIGELAKDGGCCTTDVLSEKEIEKALYKLLTDSEYYRKLQKESTERNITTWKCYVSDIVDSLKSINTPLNELDCIGVPAELRCELNNIISDKDEKKLVLVVSNYYPPNFVGGAEIIAHNQAKSLVKHGLATVVVISMDYSEKYPYGYVYTELYEGILVIRFSMPGSYCRLGGINFYDEKFNEMFEYIVKYTKADVLHGHNIIGTSLGIIDIAKKNNMKVCITLHDKWGYCLKNTTLNSKGHLCKNIEMCEECVPELVEGGIRIPMSIRKNYFRYILNQVDEFISPSQYLADEYIKAGFKTESMNVLWNGIDIKRFKNITHVPSERVRITFSGYFGKHKGVELLIRAVAELDKYNIEINLVGGGEEENSYRDLANKLGILRKMRFWGKVPNDKISEVYSETDIYCLPSIWPENQPVSITEAMASGLPIIATDLGGSRELVVDRHNGLLFKAGDYKDLAKKIERLVKDENLRFELGENGRKIISKYDFSKQTKLLTKIYEKGSRKITINESYILVKGKKLSNEFLDIKKYNVLLLDWVLDNDELLKNASFCIVLFGERLTISEQNILEENNVPIIGFDDCIRIV